MFTMVQHAISIRIEFSINDQLTRLFPSILFNNSQMKSSLYRIFLLSMHKDFFVQIDNVERITLGENGLPHHVTPNKVHMATHCYCVKKIKKSLKVFFNLHTDQLGSQPLRCIHSGYLL